MHRLPFAQQFFIILQAMALVGLLARVYWTQLYRTYVYFFDYLLLTLIQIALLSFFFSNSRAYLYLWMATEASILCFYTLTVLEAYSLVFRDLPGIASLARRYIKGTLAIAVLISFSLLVAEKSPNTFFRYFMVCDRVIVSSLVFFVLSCTLFIAYYPVPLSRNVVVYSMGYAVYLLAKATALFISNSSFSWYKQFDTAMLATSTTCLLFWLLTLNKSGETRTVVVGHRWKSGDEERLLAKLQAINTSLLRASRK